MYFPLCKQLQLVCLFPYCMEDSEGYKKLAFKLLVPLRFDVFAIQPDFLTRSIATTFYSLVMGSFL